MVNGNEFSVITDAEVKAIYSCINNVQKPYEIVRKERMSPVEMVMEEYIQEITKRNKKLINGN